MASRRSPFLQLIPGRTGNLLLTIGASVEEEALEQVLMSSASSRLEPGQSEVKGNSELLSVKKYMKHVHLLTILLRRLYIFFSNVNNK